MTENHPRGRHETMEIRQSGSNWSVHRITKYYIVGDDHLSDTVREDDEFITVLASIKTAELAVMYFYLGRGESKSEAKGMSEREVKRAIAKKYDN